MPTMLPASQPEEVSSPGGIRTAGRRALWANAAAVAFLALVLLGRSGDDAGGPASLGGFLPKASGQVPIAGGGGLYLMPAQLARDIWGVYLMDTDSQTLMVYQFDAASKQLGFLAARDFTHDRRLSNYNTFPDPQEIRNIADKEQQTRRLQED